ncbi:hypothetical protein Y032_0258g462 [Ancylostoma ceylanicum]|uniref:Reverse transcriptase domain-containing protein n=1 Tax=Ancylostoma ceylanicum TaxID=53326 RepID=A0A016SBH7_9BILA|nr:hypothetical protein Y032_0258g462 [Ancylostoma ceylanicum]
MTKPNRRKIDKRTWLWTDGVKTLVREKKRRYHAFLDHKTPDNWRVYRVAKKAAKKAVATTKAAYYDESRQRKAEDIEKFHGINDERGQLLMHRKQVTRRWRDYFEHISTGEFDHPRIPSARPVYGPIQKITTEKIVAALKQMKGRKATGPDDLAAELWKSRCWNPVGWLTKFFNMVVTEKRTPDTWQRSTTVPIWKGKGNLADCANYRPIRLLSHTMKIFERIIDSRIRDIVRLSSIQCGFVSNCGTTDAIHCVRLLIEKHRQKQKPLHLAFLDLEKAFDRVPREVI